MVVPAPVQGLARTLQSIAGQTGRTWSLTILVSETSESHVENLVTASAPDDPAAHPHPQLRGTSGRVLHVQ